MDTTEVERAEALVVVEVVEYRSHSVISTTIIRKSTGRVGAMSFDSGEEMAESVSAFDVFAQIIDGRAEVIIDGKSILLETGQSIIIPAYAPNTIIANERFKMILTIIESAYAS
jgi:quercetin dioxygenase-like cupin family protein